jgi:peptide-methionine (S)-S-oxide reductase
MKKRCISLVQSLSISIILAIPTLGAEQTAVFAGGCFWGVEAVFEHVKGVRDVRSGYAGGTKATANYEDVSNGRSRHAEAVEIKFDPAVVSYEQLLKVFFTVAHDPTELNRQGPDIGPQYRSAIFFRNAEQQKTATAFIADMTAAKAFKKKIVTQIVPLTMFYAAEDYHQDFMKKNPTHEYIVAHDVPKVEALKKQFPELFRSV